MTNSTPVDIEIPEDKRKSRLPRAPKVEPLDDFATAGQRIEMFWRKYPDGSILTEIESESAGAFSVFTARAFVRKDGDSDRPDATAHATRAGYESDDVAAQFPQETAETSAVSRALRNLGILAVPKAPRKAPQPKAEK